MARAALYAHEMDEKTNESDTSGGPTHEVDYAISVLRVAANRLGSFEWQGAQLDPHEAVETVIRALWPRRAAIFEGVNDLALISLDRARRRELATCAEIMGRADAALRAEVEQLAKDLKWQESESAGLRKQCRKMLEEHVAEVERLKRELKDEKTGRLHSLHECELLRGQLREATTARVQLTRERERATAGWAQPEDTIAALTDDLEESRADVTPPADIARSINRMIGVPAGVKALLLALYQNAEHGAAEAGAPILVFTSAPTLAKEMGVKDRAAFKRLRKAAGLGLVIRLSDYQDPYQVWTKDRGLVAPSCICLNDKRKAKDPRDCCSCRMVAHIDADGRPGQRFSRSHSDARRNTISDRTRLQGALEAEDVAELDARVEQLTRERVKLDRDDDRRETSE